MALFVVLSLLLTIPAFAEEGLALDGLLEAMEGTGVPENPAKIDLADGALVGEAPTAEANAESVKINKANFPEKDFRKYVKIHFDPDGDGKLSQAETDAVTEIRLRTVKQAAENENAVHCANLKGIEYFRNLRYLEAIDCDLTNLDLSRNTRLEELIVYENKLRKLDVSKNTALVSLFCQSNQLKKLDVRKNKKLKCLQCFDNQLTGIDVSKNTQLDWLSCGDNPLNGLDISKNKALTGLSCINGGLTKLDVSKNRKLDSLYVRDNALTSIDLSANKALSILVISGNKIKCIDIGSCPGVQKAMELKKKTTKKTVQWYDKTEWGDEPHLMIDRSTRLTAGDKVLYPVK